MRTPLGFRVYVLLLTSVCVALVLAAEPRALGPDIALNLAVFALLGAVAENMAFGLPMSGSVSLAFAVNFAALVYAGPVPAAVVAVFSAVSIQDIRDRRSLWVVLFNVLQFSLVALLAGAFLSALDISPLAVADSTSSTNFMMLAWVLAAVTMYAANWLLFAFGVSLSRGVRVADVWRLQGAAAYTVSFVVLGLLGALLALMAHVSGGIGIAALLVPFLVARRTFRVYLELTEAYTDTVRSLVRAIEAKDPYTRGHSERVAMFAKRLAQQMGRPRTEVDLLERAALLHDVGKIGIPLETLTSPNQLTAEEVQLIRRHPGLGADLIAEVEFLSDAVPVVRYHHERIDGAGYPDGVAGAAIPPLARLLAAADSYDAMTTDRAYRSKMSDEDALREMQRVAGAQLDSDVVAAFTVMPRSFEDVEVAP